MTDLRHLSIMMQTALGLILLILLIGWIDKAQQPTAVIEAQNTTVTEAAIAESNLITATANQPSNPTDELMQRTVDSGEFCLIHCEQLNRQANPKPAPIDADNTPCLIYCNPPYN